MDILPVCLACFRTLPCLSFSSESLGLGLGKRVGTLRTSPIRQFRPWLWNGVQPPRTDNDTVCRFPVYVAADDNQEEDVESR